MTELVVERIILDAVDSSGVTHWRGSLDPGSVAALDANLDKADKAAQAEAATAAGAQDPKAAALQAATKHIGLAHAGLATERSTVLANKLVIDTVLDHEHRYFINVQRPITGTSKAEVTLSPDLTLSKVTSEASDQTLSTILSALPIKELLTKIALEGRQEIGKVGDLVVVGVLEKKKVRILHEIKSWEDIGAPLRWENAEAAGYEMELTADEAPAPPAKEAPPSIKFDGKVTLPK
jgi:hypothetical protein